MEEELERDNEFRVVDGEASGPLLPPRIEEPEPVEMNPNITGIPQRFPEGAGLTAEQAREDAAQMQLQQVWRDRLNQSEVSAVSEYLAATPQAMAELLTTGRAELEPHRAELTQGIPLHLHDNVMRSLTLSGARARAERLREDQRVQARLAQQVGISRGAVQLAAGMLDADLPLMFASGGTLAAGRTALTVARTTRALTGSTTLGRAAGDFAVGLSGGALSGAIVGGAGLAVRDDYDVHTMFNLVLAGAATGGVINPAVGRIMPDRDVWGQAADLDMQDAARMSGGRSPADGMAPAGPVRGPSQSLETLDVASTTTRPQRGPGFIDRGTAAPARPAETEPAGTRLASIFTEPSTSTVSFPERGITAKNSEQLAASDAVAQELVSTNGFEELATLLDGLDVSKIAGGQEKVILDVDGYVVRVSRTAPVNSTYGRMNTPTHSGRIGDLYVEVVPRVQMDLSADEIIAFDRQVASEGVFWSDAAIGNMGRAEDGSIRIIDGVVLPPDRFDSGFSSPVPGRQYPFTLREGDTVELPDISEHPLFTSNRRVDSDQTVPLERAADRDMQSNVSAIHRDLHASRSDPDHPLNSNTPAVEEMPRRGMQVFEVDENGNLNAASLGTAATGFDIAGEISRVRAYRAWTPNSGTPRPTLDPWTVKLLDQGASETEIAMSLANREHLLDIRYQELLDEDMSNPVVRLLVGGSDHTVRVGSREIPIGQALGTFFTMGNREFTTLVHSSAPTAQWIASEILSASSGIGRNGTTAAALKDMYFYSARVHVADTFIRRRAEYYAGNRGRLAQLYKSDQPFSAEARLALDAHRQGRAVPDEWREFVDSVDRMNDELFRRMQENDVLGTQSVTANRGYFRYDIVPEKVLNAVRQSSEDAVIDAFARAYRIRNPRLTATLSTRLARASVRRRLNQARGIDAADRNRQTRAVGSAVEQVLIDEGVSPADRDAIMKLLGEQEEGRATASFLRDRVEFDMTVQIPGTDYRMVDLFSDDLETSMLQYAHEAAGSAALANKGIRSARDIDNLVNVLGREAAATGEDIDTGRIRGLFSQFTGGTHVGVDPLTGRTTEGISAAVSGLTSATRSSLLQRLGLTTIMDGANTVATNGVARSVGSAIDRLNMQGLPRQRVTAIQSGLEDIRFLTGQDHLVYRSHLAVEELNADKLNFGQSILSGLRNVENATYYLSGHHHMLSFLQRVSADATFSNLVAGLKREVGGMTERQMRDMGLTESTKAELFGLIQSGDINLNPGNKRVELGGLSREAQEELAVSMHVVVNQQMQRGMIGETSMWMNSDVGKILSALKTFGIMATQKQLARRLMVGGAPDVAISAMWQMGFAYAVLSASHAIQGTEMSTLDRARLSVVYSPVLGVGPTTVDPVMTMLGFDDLHFSPYGRFSSPLNSPVIETVERLSQSPGAIGDMLSGQGTYSDMQNARAMFFLNWYGMKRLWESM